MWLVVFGEFQENPGYLHNNFIFAQNQFKSSVWLSCVIFYQETNKRQPTFYLFCEEQAGRERRVQSQQWFWFFAQYFWSPLRILSLSVVFLQFFNFLFLSCARNNNDNIFKQFLNNFYIFILQMFSNQLFFTVTVSNFKQFNGFNRKILCFILSTLTTWLARILAYMHRFKANPHLAWRMQVHLRWSNGGHCIHSNIRQKSKMEPA